MENIGKINEAIKLFEKYGGILGDMPSELRDSFEIVKIAVQQNGCDLEYASDRLRDDREIVLYAVMESAYAKKFASQRLQNDPAVITIAKYSKPIRPELGFKELIENLDLTEDLVYDVVGFGIENECNEYKGLVEERYPKNKYAEGFLEAEEEMAEKIRMVKKARKSQMKAKEESESGLGSGE